MCGICGIVSRAPITDTSPVKLMQQAMYHRGPDGGGEFFDKHIAMAMRRLSIIDLKSGWQPLYNEDSSLVLIANGEIYNFIELREMLQSKGHRFKTGSDCETILHLYEDHGIDFLRYLRGMYTFAIWDTKRERLILARDRMGEKPLYIYEQEGRLIFASEMKSLLSSKIIPFELDPEAINLYYYYQYIPEPWTPLLRIRKLKAAHFMVIDVRSWRINETCYWKMEDALPIEGDPSTIIKTKLEEISKIIVRSDVPVGVALSGGLDSSAIATLAAREYPERIQAFSVGYPGHPPNDERNDAKALADYLDIAFHDVEINTKDMVNFFPELVYWQDDPIADISGFGYYSVMRLAREHNVPVILQGHGGDELFWGYPWVRNAVQESMNKLLYHKNKLRLYNYVNFEIPKGASIRSIYNWIKSFAGLRYGLDRYKSYRDTPEDQLIFYDLTPDFKIFHDININKKMFKDTFYDNLTGSPFNIFKTGHDRQHIDVDITKLICQTYLLENGVAQGDRLSMSSSVELRLPLLDYKLVETIIGLRKTHTDYNLPPKYWLKTALKDILPKWVLNRPKKGFTPPTYEWYRELINEYGPLINDGCLVRSGIITKDTARYLSEGPIPPGSISPPSFKSLVLELWCRKAMEIVK